MQIVIDIPEEMYKWVHDVNKISNDYGTDDFIDLIKNGTPLPKGHGRLIDADKLNKCIIDRVTMPYVPINKIQNVPTTIEADRRENGNEKY